MLVAAVPPVISGPVLSKIRVRRTGFPGTGGSGDRASWVGRNKEEGSQSLIVPKTLLKRAKRVRSFSILLRYLKIYFKLYIKNIYQYF
jgi:hypothetical protein